MESTGTDRQFHLVALGVTFTQPGWSDSPSGADPVYSEPFCLKIFEAVAEQSRSGSWQISDRNRHKVLFDAIGRYVTDIERVSEKLGKTTKGQANHGNCPD